MHLSFILLRYFKTSMLLISDITYTIAVIYKNMHTLGFCLTAVIFVLITL